MPLWTSLSRESGVFGRWMVSRLKPGQHAAVGRRRLDGVGDQDGMDLNDRKEEKERTPEPQLQATASRGKGGELLAYSVFNSSGPGNPGGRLTSDGGHHQREY